MARRSWNVLAAAVSAVAALGATACTPGIPDRPPPAPAPVAAPAAGPAPVVLTPVMPGWNPVRSVKRGAVYDVPPTWTVASEGSIVGYETSDGPRVAASGAASSGDDVCGRNTDLALSAVKHDTGTNLTAASAAVAREWADAAYRDDADREPRLSVGAPAQIITASGQRAVITKVTARPVTPAGPCRVERGAVYAVAATGFRGELGPTVVLLVVVDEYLTGADPVPGPEIRQILSTLRPAP